MVRFEVILTHEGPYWWKPLCPSQMGMAHTLWNSITQEDSSWCSWCSWGLWSQVEGQRDSYGTGISCNLQYGHIDRGLKESSMAAAHGPSPVWDPQQAPSPPSDTLRLCSVTWSYIFCKISFVPLHDRPQESAKSENKSEADSSDLHCPWAQDKLPQWWAQIRPDQWLHRSSDCNI